jgi:hypothetical protein
MNNIDELITKLGNDKYKNVSSNLEFITECGVEDSDHRDMLKDALEYLSILEEGMQLLCTLNMERKQRQINNRILWGKINMAGCTTGRIQTDKPNCIEGPKSEYRRREDGMIVSTNAVIQGQNSAKVISEEVNKLIVEYKALEEKSEMLWSAGNSVYGDKVDKRIKLDSYENIMNQMGQIEYLLRIKYNYNILKPNGSVNNDM